MEDVVNDGSLCPSDSLENEAEHTGLAQCRRRGQVDFSSLQGPLELKKVTAPQE